MLICPHCHHEFRPPVATFTPRQVELMGYLEAYIGANGAAPSLTEIANALGLASTATVVEHLENLERKGAIRRHAREHRSITLLVRSDELNPLPALATTDADGDDQ